MQPLAHQSFVWLRLPPPQQWWICGSQEIIWPVCSHCVHVNNIFIVTFLTTHTLCSCLHCLLELYLEMWCVCHFPRMSCDSVRPFCLIWVQVLDRHKALDNMVELLQVYTQEDEAYGELLEATTQLYHYLLQPFRDMREVAMLHRQQIKVIHHPQIPSVLELGLVGVDTLLELEHTPTWVQRCCFWPWNTVVKSSAAPAI